MDFTKSLNAGKPEGSAELFKAQTWVRTPDALCSFTKAEGTVSPQGLPTRQLGLNPLPLPPNSQLLGRDEFGPRCQGCALELNRQLPRLPRPSHPKPGF